MSSSGTSEFSRLMDKMDNMQDKLDIMQSQIFELTKKLDDHLMTCPGRENQQQIQSANRNSEKGIDPSKPRNIQICENDAVDISNDTTPNIQFTDTSLRQASVPRQIFRPSIKERRQECLRKSLKQNILLLVDNLPYTEADMLDMLIETECLTETECCDLRQTCSRKDAVRNMIRIIKGRSFKVMADFVDCVKSLHPEIAASIWQIYEKLLKENKSYSKACTFCFLKRSVDLKFVADNAWSIEAISDNLYDEIVGGGSCVDILWGKLADECNHLASKSRRICLQKLIAALVKKGQYKELVLKLNKESSLKCLCITVDTERSRFTGTLLDTGAIGLTSIVVTTTEENSSVSPASTTASSHSVADGYFHSDGSDDFSATEHENYFLSVRPNDREKDMYNSRFGTRKGSGSLLQTAIGQETRKSRSNSFGKDTINEKGNYRFPQRRASMFM